MLRVLILLTALGTSVASAEQVAVPTPATSDTVAVARGATFGPSGSGRVDIYCSAENPLVGDPWIFIPEGRSTELEALARMLVSTGRRAFVLDLDGLAPDVRATRLRDLLVAIPRSGWTSAGGTCAVDPNLRHASSPAKVSGVLTYGRGIEDIAAAADVCGPMQHLIAIAPSSTKGLARCELGRKLYGEWGQADVVLFGERCGTGEDVINGLRQHHYVERVRLRAATTCDASAVQPQLEQWVREFALYADSPRTELLGPDVDYETIDRRMAGGGFGFNLSVVVGAGRTVAGDRTAGGAAWGIRPEVVFGREDTSAWGYGAYAEVGSMGDRGILFGGGGTLVVPLAGRFALAPSAGVFAADVFDLGFAGGWTAGGFLGSRHVNKLSFFEAAVGLRADYRRSFDGDRSSVTVALQLDLVLPVAIAAFVM